MKMFPRIVPVLFAVWSAGFAAAPYTLFMGADVSVESNKRFHPVKDVAGGAFVLDTGRAPVSVRVDSPATKWQLKQSLKLTHASATVTGIQAGRAYSAGSDPRDREHQQMVMAESYATSAEVRELSSEAMSKQSGLSGDSSSNTGVNSLMGGPVEDLGAARSEAGRTADVMRDSADGGGAFDALAVSFKLSAPRPLDKAYVILVAKYREPGAKAGTTRPWIHAMEVGAVGVQPREYRVTQGGFPRGYVLGDVQIHLYSGGSEIATNVSPKRVELSRDEAQQYVVIDYVASHKGDTLPATPAFAELPPEIPAELLGRVSAEQRSRVYFVKVSKDGKAAAIYLDQAGKEKVTEPGVENVFAGIAFKPALEKGKPVEGVVRLKIGDLRM